MKKLLLLFSIITSFLLAVPTLGNFYFDTILVNGGESISAKPKLAIEVSPAGIIFDDFLLYIDGTQVLSTSNYNYSFDITNGVFHYDAIAALSSGIHTFQLFASDGALANKTVSAFVSNANFGLVGRVSAFPSPATKNITIGYELSGSEDLTLVIYDTKARIIYREQIPAGSEGAHAGYNFVNYDLKTADGRALGNGVYIAVLSQKVGKKIVGRTKFMVLRD